MDNHNNEKKRNNDGLFIPSRQVTVMVAVAVVLAGVLFLGGYIVGKKHVMEQVVARMEQDSFADQVYSSLCELYDYDMEEVIVADQECESIEDTAIEEVVQNEPAEPMPVVSNDLEMDAANEKTSTQIIPEQAAATISYRAQLLSYHVKKYADNFVAKLAKKGIPVEVKTRKSTTACGASKLWYQVVTGPYADRDELQKVVDRISQEEKIKGARIITC